MQQVAARKWFVADGQRLPFTAERLERCEIGRATEHRGVETEAPLEDGRGPAEAAARQRRGDGAAVTRPPGVNALAPRAVGEVFHDARSEASGQSDRRGESLRIQAHDFPDRERRGKDAARAGRVPAARVKRARHGQADARDRLVTGDGRGQDRATRHALGFARRQRRGKHDRGRVRDRAGVGVVEVEAVSERAVGENGQRQRRARLGGDDRALAAAPTLQRGEHGGRELVGRRGQRDPEDVEHAQLHALDHGGRNVGDVEVGSEDGETFSERHGGNHTLTRGSIRRGQPAADTPSGLVVAARLRMARTERPSASVASNSSHTPASIICCTSASRSWPAGGS